MEDKTNNREQVEAEESQSSDAAGLGRRRIFRILGILFISLAVLLAVYGTVVQVAWQRGQEQRVEGVKQALQEQLAAQLEYAREDMAAGNYPLALRRLDWILEQDKEFPGAASLRQEIVAATEVRETPTPFPTPTSPPQTLEAPEDETEQASSFAKLEQIIADQDWQTAVTAITAFQAQYPDYRRQQSDAMLFNAYINLGQNLVMGDQVELGLFYLVQAEKLGDIPQNVEDQRLWAELYLQGISYYGVDWGVATYYFRDLCAAAPFYQDACGKLLQALISHGDVFAFNQDWCPAEELYAEAARSAAGGNINEKLLEARTKCLEATPTPSAPITGTETVSAILPVVSSGFTN